MKNHTLHPIILLIFAVILSFTTSVDTYAQDKEFIIVLDAGHGGKDPGAVNGKMQEKSINLNVTLEVGRLLEENCPNVKVIYTRKTDVFIELYRRSDIANKAGANLFVSIHTNSARSASAYGAETYLLGAEENRTSANLNAALAENKAILYESDNEIHYEGYDPNSPESQIIFEFMQNQYQKESLKVATMVQKHMTGTAGRSDRGVHQAGFLVLWKSTMPSILIELGFVSNNTEGRYLTSQEGVKEMGYSIYKALSQYIEETTQSRTQATIGVSVPDDSSSEKPTVHDKPEKAVTTPHTETIVSDATNEGETDGKPVFKVQFLTSSTKLDPSDRRIQGFNGVEYSQGGRLYRYTCGATTSYKEVLTTLTKVKERYKDAFIVAFYKGEKISLAEARKLEGK